MVQELKPNALRNVRGMVRYPAYFEGVWEDTKSALYTPFSP
jgi:hypothetical protein